MPVISRVLRLGGAGFARSNLQEAEPLTLNVFQNNQWRLLRLGKNPARKDCEINEQT